MTDEKMNLGQDLNVLANYTYNKLFSWQCMLLSYNGYGYCHCPKYCTMPVVEYVLCTVRYSIQYAYKNQTKSSLVFRSLIVFMQRTEVL